MAPDPSLEYPGLPYSTLTPCPPGLSGEGGRSRVSNLWVGSKFRGESVNDRLTGTLLTNWKDLEPKE